MSTADYLDATESTLIEDNGEVLRRQVFPSHLIDGQPSKQAFLPTVEHNYLLSTKRGSVDPEDAHADHVARGLQSCGTWGIQVADALAVQIPAVDDAEHLNEPAHASLSFLDHDSNGQRMQRARKLRDAAACLFDANEAADSDGVDQ
ncbi:hypothetical protein [Microbacterium maritypicum]